MMKFGGDVHAAHINSDVNHSIIDGSVVLAGTNAEVIEQLIAGGKPICRVGTDPALPILCNEVACPLVDPFPGLIKRIFEGHRQ